VRRWALPALLSERPPATTEASGESSPSLPDYSVDASAVPPATAPRIDQLAHARALVRRYVWHAQAGERADMLRAYLPDTRRSAETVVARDLELAKKGGALFGGIRVYSSAALENNRLAPPPAASLVHEEDVKRLQELMEAHDDAVVVLLEFTGGSVRAVFVVRDGGDWWLLP
jgi:hypothetical protein